MYYSGPLYLSFIYSPYSQTLYTHQTYSKQFKYPSWNIIVNLCRPTPRSPLLNMCFSFYSEYKLRISKMSFVFPDEKKAMLLKLNENR